MARSISFVIEGDVDTQVTVTELDDGTLRFDLAVLGSALIGDLRGIFFDLKDVDASTAELSVASTAEHAGDVTDSAFDEASVNDLGQGANVKGSVSNALGDFDVGVEFGTSGMAQDDVRETSFILSSAAGPLSLDALDLADFGIRYTSVGLQGGKRSDSAKIGDQSNGVADNDAFSVVENTTGSVDLLANDTNGASNTVTAVFDADGAFTKYGEVFEREVIIDGRVLGTLMVTAAGIATFAANGANIDELGHDAVELFEFGYTTTAPDGSLATADAALTILGVNDQPVAEHVGGTLGEDDTSVTVSFEASDIDFGDLLSFQVLGDPTDAFGNQYGSVVNNGDGSFTFLPGDQFQFLDEGETRDVTFQYVAIDDSGVGTSPMAPEESDTSDPKTATITVVGAYDAPVDLAGSLLFVTENQSMFGTGEALVLQPDLPFFGIDEFASLNSTIIASQTFSGDVLAGILDGIEAIADFFADLGCGISEIFGGDCDHDVELPSSITIPGVGTSGFLDVKTGLQPYFFFTSGDVDASIPVDVVFTTPRQVEAGEVFSINSAFSIDGGATFQTMSPNVNFGMDFVFDLDTEFDLNVGANTIELIDFDTGAIDGFEGKQGEPGFNVFDFSAEDDLETSIDLGGLAELTLNFPVIETEGSLVDDNTLESSGEDDVAILDIDVDAVLAQIIELATGVPVTFGEEDSFGLGIDIAGTGLNLISVEYAWDLVAVNLISTLSVIQDFALDVMDLPLMATLEDNSVISGLSLGDDIEITAPTGFDADLHGDMDGLIDFEIDVDMDAVFDHLATLGFSMELFTGLLRFTGGITSDFFDGPSFSAFPQPGGGTDNDFLLSNTLDILDDVPLATLFDEAFDLEGFEGNPNTQDTFEGYFDVA